ncbi:hypothetical protein AAZV13_18G101600 [Glycine max]|nr:hypothetical protein GmHk_18G051545 [Glycine max]
MLKASPKYYQKHSQLNTVTKYEAAMAVIGFYAVIWGKSQEQAKEECEVYDDSESYSPVVPLLENKRMEE